VQTIMPTSYASPNSQTALINSQTGQPDYSLQWIDYYRSLGMHEQADVVEKRVKERQLTLKTPMDRSGVGLY